MYTVKKFISKNYILCILFSYLFSRLVTYFYFDISIDEKWLFGLWQHIAEPYLRENLFESLLYFHAQPPLWNLILGIGVKFQSYISLEVYVSTFNIICSLIIAYSSLKILKLLKFSNINTYILCLILIILSPSILFFENLPTYAHFTCVLLFLIKLYFLKIYKNYKLKYELLIYTFSTFTILSWSAYIIYFNILIFFLMLPVILREKKFYNSIIIFLLFFTLGSSPSIKNKILFDIFSNSSWTGLNAAQATGYDRQDWPLCGFLRDNLDLYNLTFKNNNNNKVFFNNEILNDKSFNDLGYIYKSQNCSSNSKKFLISNFFEISKIKFQRFISVHAHLSFDFLFKPQNWKKSFSMLENLNLNNYFKIIVFLFFLMNYCLYFFITTQIIFKKNKNYIDYFIIINLFLYTYLLLVSFYGSTWEQERMRYTGYSFILISNAILFKRFFIKQ